jgi:hypothetical protein
VKKSEGNFLKEVIRGRLLRVAEAQLRGEESSPGGFLPALFSIDYI